MADAFERRGLAHGISRAFALGMAAALVACAGTTPRGAVPSSTPGASAPLGPSGYASLVEKLEQASTSCRNACCPQLQKLPEWLVQWWAHRTETDERARRDAIGVLEHARDPRVLGLAALRIGGFSLPEDIDRLAPLVHRNEPGAPLPIPPPMSQFPVPCPAPATQHPTLGETALLALEKPTGQQFHSAAEFDAWRRANPAPERSITYWEDAMARGDPAVIGPRFRATNHDLFCRAALVLEIDSSSFQAWLGDKERLRCARRLGADRLLALVSGADRSWPELSQSERRWALQKYVLEHAVQLLRPDQADALLALRARALAGKVDAPVALLAIAASRLAPSRRRAILVSADVHGDTAGELAHFFPRAEQQRVHADFYLSGDDFSRATRQDDILDGITRAGPPARALLHAILADARLRRDDYDLVSGLLSAAKAVLSGGKVECSGLRPGGKELGRMPSAERDARIAAARAAARRCVTRLEKLLR